MGKTRTTTKATDQKVIKDRVDFIKTLDDIARKGVELDTLQAAKETALQQVLTDHDPGISDLTTEINSLVKMAEQWASPRREELFPKARQVRDDSLDHLRLPPGAALPSPAKGWTWTRLSPCSRLHAARRIWSPR